MKLILTTQEVKEAIAVWVSVRIDYCVAPDKVDFITIENIEQGNYGIFDGASVEYPCVRERLQSTKGEKP